MQVIINEGLDVTISVWIWTFYFKRIYPIGSSLPLGEAPVFGQYGLITGPDVFMEKIWNIDNQWQGENPGFYVDFSFI